VAVLGQTYLRSEVNYSDSVSNHLVAGTKGMGLEELASAMSSPRLAKPSRAAAASSSNVISPGEIRMRPFNEYDRLPVTLANCSISLHADSVA